MNMIGVELYSVLMVTQRAGSNAFVDLTEVAWRIFSLVVRTSEAIGLICLLAGFAGYVFSVTPVTREGRAQQLMLGGGATLLSVLFVRDLYAAVVWVFTGKTGAVSATEVIYPDAVKALSGLVPKVALAVDALASVTAILGLTGVVGGTALWTIATDPDFSKKGWQSIKVGLEMQALSVGGRLFSGLTYVLINLLVGGVSG